MPVLLSNPLFPETDNPLTSVEVPIIPPNSLRGAFRRACAGVVFDAIKESDPNGRIDRMTYHSMMCGSPTASPDGKVTLDDIVHAQKDPFLSLFGGGPRMLTSGYRVMPGWPKYRFMIDQGIIPFQNDETITPLTVEPRRSGMLFTGVLAFAKVDDLTRFSDPKACESVKEYEKAVAEWMGDVSRSQEKRAAQRKEKTKGEDAEKKMGLASLNCVEFIPPGTPFWSEVIFSPYLTPAAIGLFLLGLQRWLNKQSIGGWGRAGFGRFDALVKCEGVALFDKTTGSFTATDPAEELIAKWKEESKKIKPNILDELHAPAKNKDKKDAEL